jgi:hypothetical protein
MLARQACSEVVKIYDTSSNLSSGFQPYGCPVIFTVRVLGLIETDVEIISPK